MKYIKLPSIITMAFMLVGASLLTTLAPAQKAHASHCEAPNAIYENNQGMKYATWGCGNSGVALQYENQVPKFQVTAGYDDRKSDGYCVVAKYQKSNNYWTTLGQSCGAPKYTVSSENLYSWPKKVRLFRGGNYLTIWTNPGGGA